MYTYHNMYAPMHLSHVPFCVCVCVAIYTSNSLSPTVHVVSYVELANMRVIHNGDRAISLSGYNSTIRNISVEGNGCGGISMPGGDQVRNILYLQLP